MANISDTFSGSAGTLITAYTGTDGQTYSPFGQITDTSQIDTATNALRRSNPNAVAAHYALISGTPAPITGPEFEVIVTFACYSELATGFTLGVNRAQSTFLDWDGVLFMVDGTNAYIQEVENSSYGNLDFAALVITCNSGTPPNYRLKFRGGSQGRLRIYKESSYLAGDWSLVTSAGYRAYTDTTLFGPHFGANAGWGDSAGLHIKGYALTDSVALIPTDINVVCFGNSLTQGSGATTPWPYLMEAQLNPNTGSTDNNYCVIKKGTSGIDLATLLSTYPTVAAPLAQSGYRNNVLVIQEGTNSIIGGQTGAQCLATLDSLITLALVDYDSVVLVDCIPSGAITGGDETDRLTYNAGLASRANGTTIFHANVCASTVFDAVPDAATDYNNATYYLNPPADTTHLKDAGYVVMEPYIRSAVIAAAEPDATMIVTVNDMVASEDGTVDVGVASGSVPMSIIVTGLHGAMIVLDSITVSGGIIDVVSPSNIPGTIIVGGSDQAGCSLQIDDSGAGSFQITSDYGDGEFDVDVTWSDPPSGNTAAGARSRGWWRTRNRV